MKQRRGPEENFRASVGEAGIIMTKFWKAAVAVGCTFAVAIGFTACDFGETKAKSAYQVAVDNGFKGTEADWLKSLHGADGGDGKDLDIKEVYAAAQDSGYEGTFFEFLKEYLSADIAEDNDTEIIAHNLMSVVSVYCGFEVTTATGGFMGSTTTTIKCSAGSGVIYELNKDAGNAYIITNYHVVYNAESNSKISESIYLYLYGGMNMFNTATGKDEGGSGIPATYVGGSMTYDIAVLQVQGSQVLRESAAEAAEIGDSESLSVGEKVFAIGNPEGEGISVTEGALSVESEYISLTTADEKSTIDFRVMRTDAAINSGNSGGALFDAQGKLIGITNAKRVDQLESDRTTIDSVDNIGYALPITQVKYAVENILDNNGGIKRAMFGISVQLTDSKAVLENGKVVIVEENSVADVSSGTIGYGVFKKGDVIKSITIGGETKQITRRYQMIDRMLNVRKGDTVLVTVERDGAEKVLSFTFDKDKYFDAVA